jgi:hypothetical protein
MTCRGPTECIAGNAFVKSCKGLKLKGIMFQHLRNANILDCRRILFLHTLGQELEVPCMTTNAYVRTKAVRESAVFERSSFSSSPVDCIPRVLSGVKIFAYTALFQG